MPASMVNVQTLPPRVFERLEAMSQRERECGEMLSDPGVISDQRKAMALRQEQGALSPVAEAYRQYKSFKYGWAEAEAMVKTEADPELVSLARQEAAELDQKAREALEKAIEYLLTSDDRAVGSVILEVRAGTGGDEASLWASDLLQMYSKFAASRRWHFEILEASAEASVGGVRNASVSVRGAGVWTYLNFEAGVHSVKRVPATEAQGRIHTSTATVAVLPEPEEVDVKIDWANDVEEHVTTSQGPGGQNVNKVATAVQLRHKATGIMIRMQESKSQSDNRQRAKRLLLAKLYEIERRKQQEQRSAARTAQIGSGERSEKIRTYRWKEGIVADERLPGEYSLRDIMSGNMTTLFEDLQGHELARRLTLL